MKCIQELTKICINIEKEFQYDKETNYIDIYEFLYKALNSSNFINEDLDRWKNVAKKASPKIEQILTEEDILRSIKSSLE